MAAFPSQNELQKLLGSLLAKDVQLTAAGAFAPHPSTALGLIDNDDNLVYVMGSDLAFAHRSGAALAMIPAGGIDSVDEPDADLIEVYHEVANVISRAVNESSSTRVRLDPGVDLGAERLVSAVTGKPSAIFGVNVDGYGDGTLGIWAT
ncbi:MAG: hypothetical protein GXP35_17415 [Actinobacteria bacterium]|nr:hypothetical protein [Actinomycetota bacterium]